MQKEKANTSVLPFTVLKKKKKNFKPEFLPPQIKYLKKHNKFSKFTRKNKNNENFKFKQQIEEKNAKTQKQNFFSKLHPKVKLLLAQLFVMLCCFILYETILKPNFPNFHHFLSSKQPFREKFSTLLFNLKNSENSLVSSLSTSTIYHLGININNYNNNNIYNNLNLNLNSNLMTLEKRKTYYNYSCPLGQEPQCVKQTSFDIMFILQLFCVLILICFSGLFSGLTLGLLGLDKVQLDIVAFSGSKKEKWYASQIKPIRKRGNLLLCTLLLGNVMVNNGISVLTTELGGGMVGFIISTIFITLFGEIFPQAMCARYALAIGAYTVWIVWIIMFFLFPLSFPISVALDFILGQELGQIYSKNELKKLVQIHYQSPQSKIDREEAKIFGGALEFSEETVSKIMTPIEDAFMLEYSTKLNMDTMSIIWESGHSRIPVYKDDMKSIKGVLYVKDLILVNPEDDIPLSTILAFYGREVKFIPEDTHLDDILDHFKSGKTHIAIVQRPFEPEEGGDQFDENIGLVTLEDVIEEIIKDEIVDETDVFIDNTKGMMNVFRKGTFDNNFISFKNYQVKRAHRLTPKIIEAVVSYLMKEFKCFQLLNENEMKMIISKSQVFEIEKPNKFDQNPNKEDQSIFLYKNGEVADYFFLILDGKIQISSGVDSFTTNLGSWSTLGMRTFEEKSFIPDFSASVIEKSKLIKIDKTKYIEIILEKMKNDKTFTIPNHLNWIKSENQNDIKINKNKNKIKNQNQKQLNIMNKENENILNENKIEKDNDNNNNNDKEN